jgi:Bacteriophage probable baseplate hub protein
MATALRVYDEPETFYVPDLEVKVAGQPLPDPVVRDVLEVKYTDNVDEIDSFELTLANWDAEAFAPKYEPPSAPEREGLFDPGKTLELSLGYAGDLRLMLTGVITTLEPSFPTSGGLTLAVRGLNVLHRFRTEQHSYAWEEKTDSQIAADLGHRPVQKGKPGLGIRVKTAPRDEPSEPYVFMDNQYDIVFLLNRARRRGYELVLQQGETSADEYLYFGPSDSRGEPPAPYILEWGRSLISFRPTLSTATQISEVVVRGWDRRRNRPIEGKASWQDLVPAGSERSRMQVLAQAFGSRREIVTDRPVHTKQQADAMAKEILRDKLKSMVQASGSVVGLPDLRAGRKVQIVGLGPRFEGEYYVTETTHSIGESGYTTEFKARREDAASAGATSGGGS